MVSGPPQSPKWLVVIPNGGLSWHLWCIDFTRNAIENGKSIVVLDLQRYALSGKKLIFIKKMASILYRKNRVSNLVANLSRHDNVTYLKPKNINWSELGTIEYHKLNSDSYRNGLDAEYFEELGARVLDDSQLDSKVLLMAKNVFNQVSAITQSVIQQEKITKVVVPGGRTLIPSACLSSTQNLGVDCIILESAPAGDFGYSEYPSNFRSHFGLIQLEINRRWQESDNSKFVIAELYLKNKLERDFSKTFDLKLDLDDLPIKNTVAVFPTSGFEFRSFGPTNSGEYGRSHQREMVKVFCQVAMENGFEVILRAHPPIFGHEELSAMDDEEWAPFCLENKIIYLASNSGVNSYELMKRTKLNAVYVSTAAIDSLILGKDTLILGNAEFAHLVPELCAFDIEAIRRRFDCINLKTEIIRIYPYAFYSATLGKEIPHASITSEGTILYEGKVVDAPRFRLFSWLRKRI